ncbi:hypothetical protein THIOM_001378 [Candidatus Thiomargarita nelsonii]|uniref:Uncharacterized protein n=1 Tax=Candidatus Thiomargarita nelsonii TaxID=1003181 RepID=A0A176S4G9_9GAMM|nr:hypothetical protein THIOM_001378 [Candidatus Thiomargarita nelsonii]
MTKLFHARSLVSQFLKNKLEMLIENIYQFKTELDKQGIFFCFSGPISQKILVDIGYTLRYQINQREHSSTTVLKVFSRFVQQTENIIYYSAENADNFLPQSQTAELSDSVIVVGYEQGHYYVLCGRVFDKRTVDTLSEQLIILQNLNKDELNLYYKQEYQKARHIGSQGAKLGLIELARWSIFPIEFDFNKVDEGLYFFYLKTVV